MMRKYLMISGAAFVLGAGSMALVGAAATAKTEAPSRKSYQLLQMFGDVMEAARTKYVVPIDSDREQKMIEAAINGMMANLDPHSAYLNAADYGDMRDTTRGLYGGLGIEVSAKDGAVQIISPMDDSPASRVGLQPEDYIVAIDGVSVVGMPLTDAIKKMKGDPGQEITLTIARENVDPFDVKLKREIIKPKAATVRMDGDMGYLRLGSGFNEKTTEEAQAGVKSLLAQNPNMKGLVLDLRNNPGGLLDQAVSISDMFLDGGEVVSQRGRDPNDIERYNAKPGDILNGRPMVVLINPGSASAAEIVAGALKDRRRAETVGLTSFGKGSVQTVIPIRGGVDGALKLTTGRYYTPSGRSIQRIGIEPDLEVAASIEQADALRDQAFQSSEATEYNALDASEGKLRRGAHEAAEAPPKAFEDKCKEPTAEQKKPGVPDCDFQLTRALDVLHYGSVAATPKLPMPTRLADASSIPGLVNGKVPDKRILINPTTEAPTLAPLAAKTPTVKPKPKAKVKPSASDKVDP
jgi:carboxyl-terminal processing protease